jgi:hypothetical protein
MDKATIGVLSMSLLALGGQEHYQAPSLRLKEERMTLEYTATADEAVVIMEAESEIPLDRLEIRDPRGARVLEMRAQGGHPLAVSGFSIESAELDGSSILDAFGEGTYTMRARSLDGRPVEGGARLVHGLLPAPVVLYPLDGDDAVPSEDLEIRWMPDARATAYRIVLEQNENDGLRVDLPPGSDSFRVPNGLLQPSTETLVEVGVVAPNGNCTLVEFSVETR